MNINGTVISQKQMKTVGILAGVALVLGLLLGLAFGSHGNRAEAEAKPAPTVTVTATPEAAEPVIQVPQECLDALDNADEGFTIAGNMFGKYGDGVKKILAGDNDGASADIADINELSQNLDNVTPNYVSNKEACRAAAQ